MSEEPIDAAANPHYIYGCDFCPDQRRIRGPARYNLPGKDVDCCAECFQSCVPEAERGRFLCFGKPLPASTPADAKKQISARYAIWLEPRPGAVQQHADKIISELSALVLLPTGESAGRFRSHITISSGFTDIKSAIAAASEAVSAFRQPDGTPTSFSLGALMHEAAFFRCVSAPVRPRQPLETAWSLAEKSKRSTKGGQPSAVFNQPHLSLLYADMGEVAERENMIKLAGGAGAFEDLQSTNAFEAGSVSVWDVTARPDYSLWAKVWDTRV